MEILEDKIRAVIKYELAAGIPLANRPLAAAATSAGRRTALSQTAMLELAVVGGDWTACQGHRGFRPQR